jgi:hypothetical protein
MIPILQQVDRGIGIAGYQKMKVRGVLVKWQEGGKGEDIDLQIDPMDMAHLVAEELEHQQYHAPRQAGRGRNRTIENLPLISSLKVNDR